MANFLGSIVMHWMTPCCAKFINAAINKYHGLTQANPLAPALYKGWWRPKAGASVDIDYLTYLFGLVRNRRG